MDRGHSLVEGQSKALEPNPELPRTESWLRSFRYAPQAHAFSEVQWLVAQLVACGLADKEIAYVLGISGGAGVGALLAMLLGFSLALSSTAVAIKILEDIGEIEAAKIMLGGLLVGGQVTDERELRFLTERLEELKNVEKQTQSSKNGQFIRPPKPKLD